MEEPNFQEWHEAFRQNPLSFMFDMENIQQNKSHKKLKDLNGPQKVLAALRTSKESGIQNTSEDRKFRIETFGTNLLVTKPPKSLFELILEQLEDFVLRILIVASIVSFVIEMAQNPSTGWIDSTVILIAVAIVVTVSAVNDYYKNQQFVQLNKQTELCYLKGIRNGKNVQISSRDLLAGDVLMLSPGTIVPGDGLLIQSFDMFVDESMITGESDLVPKEEFKDGLGHPFLISGSVVASGTGLMVLCQIGENSQVAKNKQLLESEEDNTPLQDKLEVTATQIGKVGLGAAIIVFLALSTYRLIEAVKESDWGVDTIQDILNYLILSVLIIVMAIPEGLPLAVTLALAYSVIKMRRENCFVRHLKACETMGGANEVLTDKTGTLTQNKMSITMGKLTDKEFEANQLKNLNYKLKCFLKENIVRNVQGIFQDEEGKSVTGAGTEGALLNFVQTQLDNFQVPDAQKVWEQGFSSNIKKMTSIYEEEGLYKVYSKGAIEVIIENCKFYYDDDLQKIQFEKQDKERILSEVGKLVEENCLRIIAFSYQDYDQAAQEFKDLDRHMIFLGFLGLIDPLRPETQKVVKSLHKAGINVRMITGDAVPTAINIAQKCNIISKNDNPENFVITGEKFSRLIGPLVPQYNKNQQIVSYQIEDLENFKHVIKDIKVIARCTPENKLALVLGLKQLEQVVAVTGDGSNDYLALKKSDVGLAMMSGTALAKESSDIILLDDSLSTVLCSVLWGRNVYQGISKFLQFQLTVNIVAMAITIIGSIVVCDSPLKPVQILWVNLIMDSFGALALATEPPSKKMLHLKPYDRSQNIISPQMMASIAIQSVYQITILLLILFLVPTISDVQPGWEVEAYSSDNAEHYTWVFNTFVFMQLFNLLNCRKIENDELNVFQGIFNNWFFVLIWILIFAGQVLLVEFGGKAVNTSGQNINEYGMAAACGAMSIIISTVHKVISQNASCISKKNSSKKEQQPLIGR